MEDGVICKVQKAYTRPLRIHAIMDFETQSWCSSRQPGHVRAAAKGRSSSPALCRVLQGAEVCAAETCMSIQTVPSGTPVDPPSKELPLWYSDLLQGRTYRFEGFLLAGRWLRLLLLLGGDIEPHPGPRQPVRIPRGRPGCLSSLQDFADPSMAS